MVALNIIYCLEPRASAHLQTHGYVLVESANPGGDFIIRDLGKVPLVPVASPAGGVEIKFATGYQRNESYYISDNVETIAFAIATQGYYSTRDARDWVRIHPGPQPPTPHAP